MIGGGTGAAALRIRGGGGSDAAGVTGCEASSGSDAPTFDGAETTGTVIGCICGAEGDTVPAIAPECIVVAAE